MSWQQVVGVVDGGVELSLPLDRKLECKERFGVCCCGSVGMNLKFQIPCHAGTTEGWPDGLYQQARRKKGMTLDKILDRWPAGVVCLSSRN